jgi:hypothetical protein
MVSAEVVAYNKIGASEPGLGEGAVIPNVPDKV